MADGYEECPAKGTYETIANNITTDGTFTFPDNTYRYIGIYLANGQNVRAGVIQPINDFHLHRGGLDMATLGLNRVYLIITNIVRSNNTFTCTYSVSANVAETPYTSFYILGIR